MLVESVTPNVGSFAGGTDITITGTNFSTSQTEIYIGEGVNMVCVIKTITAT